MKQNFKHLYVCEHNGKTAYFNPFNYSIVIDDNTEKYNEVICKFLETCHEMKNDGSSIIDEARKVLYENKDLHQLYMILTTGCNYACKYCRQKQGKSSLQSERMSRDVAFDMVDKFLSAKSRSRKGIVFYGGEPLLELDLMTEIISYVREKNSDIELTIFTNGSLITDELARFLAANNVFIIISYDGLPRCNDELRVTVSGCGTSVNTVQGFETCKKNGCKVGFSMTIGAHNISFLEESIKYLHSLGPANIGFNLPHDDEDNPLHVDSTNDFVKEAIRLFWNATEDGLRTEHILKKLRLLTDGKFKFVDCPAAFGRIVAMPNGDIGLCEGAIGYPGFFTKEDSFSNLDEVREKWKEQLPIFDERCRNCRAIGICGGGCLLDGYFEEGVLSNYNSIRCKFAKEMIDTYIIKLLESISVDTYPYLVTGRDREDFLNALSCDKKDKLLATSSEIGEIKTTTKN